MCFFAVLPREQDALSLQPQNTVSHMDSTGVTRTFNSFSKKYNDRTLIEQVTLGRGGG